MEYYAKEGKGEVCISVFFLLLSVCCCLFSCANMKISIWSNFKARSLKPARWSFCFGYKLAFLIPFLPRENLFTDPNVWFKFCLTFWLAPFWCHVAGLLLWAECVQGILVRRGKDKRSYWRRRLASLGWRGRMAAGECNMYSYETVYPLCSVSSRCKLAPLPISPHLDEFAPLVVTSSPSNGKWLKIRG